MLTFSVTGRVTSSANHTPAVPPTRTARTVVCIASNETTGSSFVHVIFFGRLAEIFKVWEKGDIVTAWGRERQKEWQGQKTWEFYGEGGERLLKGETQRKARENGNE